MKYSNTRPSTIRKRPRRVLTGHGTSCGASMSRDGGHQSSSRGGRLRKATRLGRRPTRITLPRPTSKSLSRRAVLLEHPAGGALRRRKGLLGDRNTTRSEASRSRRGSSRAQGMLRGSRSERAVARTCAVRPRFARRPSEKCSTTVLLLAEVRQDLARMTRWSAITGPAATAPRSPTARTPRQRRKPAQRGRTPRAGTLLGRALLGARECWTKRSVELNRLGCSLAPWSRIVDFLLTQFVV